MSKNKNKQKNSIQKKKKMSFIFNLDVLDIRKY